MMQYIPDIISTVLWIFTAVCWWKVFTKANVAGWKALIPFYSDYNRYKIVGKEKMYWLYLVASAAQAVYSVFSKVVLAGNILEFLGDGTFNGTGIEMKIISWTLTIVLFALNIYLGRHLAKSFGKSDAFGVGIGLLPIVFVPILAFGKAEYIRKEWI